MAKSLDEVRKRLDDEYGQVRRHFEDIHKALDEAEKGGPEDDLEGLLGKLQDAVKKARTGGVLGHGANGHARARKEYLELKKG